MRPAVIDINDISSGQMSFKYAKTDVFWEAVFSFPLIQLFDSFGTILSTISRAGTIMKDSPETAMRRVNSAMIIDS
jgi:xanthine/uracil/vitamin C permease (AzgA family)